MTKKEIVKQISDEIGLTQLKTKEIVQKTFDAIIETLVRERRIELRNFGVFEVKRRAARKARNPRTGEKVDVAEKFVVTFKPGKEMEEKVLELEAAARAAAAGTQPHTHSPSIPLHLTLPTRTLPRPRSRSAVPRQVTKSASTTDDQEIPASLPFDPPTEDSAIRGNRNVPQRHLREPM